MDPNATKQDIPAASGLVEAAAVDEVRVVSHGVSSFFSFS